MKNDPDFQKVIQYMQTHWPSPVKPEWQVSLDEYPAILAQAISDLSANATKNRRFFRITGISGSGKTTQILPAVEAYCKKAQLRPIFIAARKFLKYHPHYQAILDHYGKQDLRKMTDEFVTIMLFGSIVKLISAGFDIVLDVTLLSPDIEAILLKYLKLENYHFSFFMVATSPAVTEYFLSGRSWRHSAATEQEFIRATELALDFYAQNSPAAPIIIWSVYDQAPVYDGPIKNCLPIFEKYSQNTTLPQKDDDARRQAKLDYLTKA